MAAPAFWPLPLLFAAFLWHVYRVHCNRDQVSTFQVLECQAITLCHTVSVLPFCIAGRATRNPLPSLQLPSALSGLWRLWGFSLCSWYSLLCAVSVNLFLLHRPRARCAFLPSGLQAPVCSDTALLSPAALWDEVSNSGLPHPRPPFHAFAFFSGGAFMIFFLVMPALSHHL